LNNIDEEFPGEELTNLLDLTDEEFQKRYGETSFAWVGKERLQRNLVLALGCNGNDKHIPLLRKALQSLSPMVRSYAEWSLDRICGS